MDIGLIARQSLKEIKDRWDLPDEGFLAGGSIANLVWEKVSGTKAVINDLDIYKFHKKVSLSDVGLEEKQNYKHRESLICEDYSGYHQSFITKEFYSIESAERSGIFNTILYNSSGPCPETIIKSFDINCCQIGYDIQSDKFYWAPGFERFLNTGLLEVDNLSTPAHTAIRIVKKSKEMNARIDPIQMDMIDHSILYNNHFYDHGRVRFKERYEKLYHDFEDVLSDRFKLVEDTNIQTYLSIHKGSDDRIWTLEPIRKSIFVEDLNISPIRLTRDFIFYATNIFGDYNLEKIWANIQRLFNTGCEIGQYLDIELSVGDLEFLHNFIDASPRSTNNLRGLTLSNQLLVIRSLLSRYSHDPIVAMSILERHTVDPDQINDDFLMLLLELSVRGEILSDPRNKVDRLNNNVTKSVTNGGDQFVNF